MTPTFRKLCWISLLSDVSSEMLYPVLPLFLTATLGAGMASVGLIEGAAELTASLLKARMGIWSDRLRRRRPFIAFGYGLSTFAKGAIGLATGWGWVLAARVLDRVGKGVRTAPRDALIAESVPREKLGYAFGIHRLMDTTGAVIGPLIAVALMSVGFDDLRKFFILAILPGAVAVALTFALRESGGDRPHPRPSSLGSFSGLPGGYRRYLAAWGLFSLANSSDVFILLRMKSAGIGTISMILVYCGYNAVYAALSGVFGGLSDRIGERRVLQYSLAIFAAAYAVFALAASLAGFIAGYLIYGVYMAMSEGVSKAYVGRLAGADEQGSAQGYFGLVTGVCLFGASTIAGILWERAGPAAPFVYGVGGALLGLLALRRLKG